jgi:hypothetical protein
MTEHQGHEEATVHRIDLFRAADPGPARPDHQDRGSVLISTTVALPLALLPTIALIAALWWMAASSQSS